MSARETAELLLLVGRLVQAEGYDGELSPIRPDTEPGLEKWLAINSEFARVWPNITVKREPPPVQRSGKACRASMRNTFRPSLATATSGLEQRPGLPT